MKHVFLLLLIGTLARAQSILPVYISDAQTGQPIPGATILVLNTSTGNATNADGVATLTNVPDGPQRLRVSAVGYQTLTQPVTLPANDTLRIALPRSEEELEEVVVTSTRSGRNVADEPTRVEVIDAEELDEKANMQPANISVILRESTGIQVQQTSVTSANVTFRIQGLDGRYTQLLQDGLPLYSGFSSGLSLLQIPPLNLKQVEVIKGCQSTLYGSGAIAGLVNLVTKDPTDERELSFLINGTSAGGLDLNGYYAQKYGKLGLTFYTTHNRQRAYDPNRDNFTDIPDIVRTTLQPKLFWYVNPATTVSAGLIWSNESRTGGYMPALSEPASGYREINESRRLATQFRLDTRLPNEGLLTIKNSYSQFGRDISLVGPPTINYQFDGRQRSTYSEVSYFNHNPKADWIIGVNLWTDAFSTPPRPATGSEGYQQAMGGLFVQNTLTLSDKLSLETGLRADLAATSVTNGPEADRLRAFLLPRFSLLYRPNAHWTSRLGGGLGYKAPTLFIEDAERVSFQGVSLGSLGNVRSEESAGLNWDFNYRTELAENLTLSINQLFFLTRLNRPVLLDYVGYSLTQTYRNADGHITTRGFETNARLKYHAFHAFFGYSLIDARRYFAGDQNTVLPLTARHRFYSTFMLENDRIKTGFEAFYTGRQYRTNGTETPSYWQLGYMAEVKWGWGSLYINFENFLDVRQSRFEPLVTGTPRQPVFVRDIYAPTDGRVINGGIKLKL